MVKIHSVFHLTYKCFWNVFCSTWISEESETVHLKFTNKRLKLNEYKLLRGGMMDLCTLCVCKIAYNVGFVGDVNITPKQEQQSANHQLCGRRLRPWQQNTSHPLVQQQSASHPLCNRRLRPWQQSASRPFVRQEADSMVAKCQSSLMRQEAEAMVAKHQSSLCDRRSLRPRQQNANQRLQKIKRKERKRRPNQRNSNAY